jgi:beta-lactam-binding protein with PASTA domain
MLQSKRGRKKKEVQDISHMNKDEYIAYLEAKTAYLEELQRMMH